MSDDEYLRKVEVFAHAVVEQAAGEGWLNFIEGEDGNETLLRRSINELARTLRMVHYQGDGCIDH